VVYEGQAAIELEQLAAAHGERLDSYPCAMSGQTPFALDVAPLLRAIVSDIQHSVPDWQIARRFHSSIAELLATACLEARRQSTLNVVALSGGVFQNRLLLEQLVVRLEEMAFQVYINRRVPPNDGGVSLGQIAVAAARLQADLTPDASAR
jgi:hydrogenase maturation protein HypF